jgi:hypothetical protein
MEYALERVGRRTYGPGEEAVVAGRAQYRGRPCYIAGRIRRGRTRWEDEVVTVQSQDGSRVLCYSPDGARQWWAPTAEVEVQRAYRRPQTIGGLMRFREEARRNGGVHPDACPQCGSLSCSAARGRGGLCDED